MIISDLSYLEVVEESNVVGASGVYVNKDVNIDVNVNQDFDSDVYLDVDKDVYIDFDSYVNISGNFGSVIGDATAIGDNSVAEIDFAVTVTDDLAEASVTAIAAVG